MSIKAAALTQSHTGISRTRTPMTTAVRNPRRLSQRCSRNSAIQAYGGEGARGEERTGHPGAG